MLGVLTQARCEAYVNLIRKYHTRYGAKCWTIIYQAEVRARQEQWERCRRLAAEEQRKAAAAGLAHEYDPDMPWEHSRRMLVESVRFWKDELEDPCMLILTKSASASAFVETEGDHKRDTEKVKSPGIKLRLEDKSHNVTEGRYTTNRRGVRLCEGFNAGECKEVDKYGRCAKDSNRVHQCNRCLSTDHIGSSCTKTAPEFQRGRGRGGKGSGKRRTK